jgi:hypothetical protein
MWVAMTPAHVTTHRSGLTEIDDKRVIIRYRAITPVYRYQSGLKSRQTGMPAMTPAIKTEGIR